MPRLDDRYIALAPSKPERPTIRLSANGTMHGFDLDPNRPLMWAIRDRIGPIGTSYGCGQCGSCAL